MRRQDLITALVRHPDHVVLVDGNAVTGLEVTRTNVVLRTDKPAPGTPTVPDQRVLEAEKRARLEALDLARAEGRAEGDAEIARLRDAIDAERTAAVEQAVADAIAVERAGREQAIAEAVASAVASVRAEGAGA